MRNWYRRFRCWWSGHTDQHVWPDQTMTCGRCGAAIHGDRSLRGNVTIHVTEVPV